MVLSVAGRTILRSKTLENGRIDILGVLCPDTNRLCLIFIVGLV